MKFEWDEDKNDVLFVVFTERKDRIRLISARSATDIERRLYYDQDIHY